jgi:hypothetical protein
VLEIALESLEGGPEMIASAATERRELAHRSTNGIEVTLLWTGSTNTVGIAVLDTHSGEELEFDVDGSAALDAFNHPYAYAATVRVDRTQAADRDFDMYSPAFQMLLADARIGDLRRGRATSIQSHGPGGPVP